MTTKSNEIINKKATAIFFLLIVAFFFSDRRFIYAQTSKDAREIHNFGIYGNSSPFVNLYWIVNQDFQIGAYHLDNHTFYFGERGLYEMIGDERLLYGQFFIGNSFNIRGGVGKRRVTTSEFIIDQTTEERYRCHISGEANIVSLSIGNQWTIGYFTFGGQWYGRARPLNRPKITNDCINYIPTRRIGDSEEKVKEYGFSEYDYFPILFMGVQF